MWPKYLCPFSREGAAAVGMDYLRLYLDRSQALESVGLSEQDVQVDA
jgi:hypothetical protein